MSSSPGVNAGALHRAASTPPAARSVADSVFGDVALLDAGALDDPLVGRVDADCREVDVREHRRRDASPRAGEVGDRTLHAASPTSASPRAAADVFVHLRLDRLDGDLDRVLDRARRRLAVRDDADAVDAEQRRAAVLGVVELLERVHHRFLIDARLGEQADDERRDRLVELEHDVADEPVADDDVDRAAVALPGRQVAPLDVADEVEPGRLEELVRFLRRRRCPSPALRRCSAGRPPDSRGRAGLRRRRRRAGRTARALRRRSRRWRPSRARRPACAPSGKTVAIAGRLRPACSLSTTIDAAICAPVLPAETNASDSPSACSLRPTIMELFGLLRMADAGLVGHLDDVRRLDDL